MNNENWWAFARRKNRNESREKELFVRNRNIYIYISKYICSRNFDKIDYLDRFIASIPRAKNRLESLVMHALGDRTRAINFKDRGKDHEIRDRPTSTDRQCVISPAGIYCSGFVSRFSPMIRFGQSGKIRTFFHREWMDGWILWNREICRIELIFFFFGWNGKDLFL